MKERLVDEHGEPGCALLVLLIAGLMGLYILSETIIQSIKEAHTTTIVQTKGG